MEASVISAVAQLSLHFAKPHAISQKKNDVLRGSIFPLNF